MKIKMDNQTIKQIFEREIQRHSRGITEHKNKYIQTNSKQQQRKMDKHFHKHFQTILLAKQLGFTFCECCGTLLTRGSSRQNKKCRDDGSNVSLHGTPKQLVGKNNKDEHMPPSADTHSAEKLPKGFKKSKCECGNTYGYWGLDVGYCVRCLDDIADKKSYDDYTDGLFKW